MIRQHDLTKSMKSHIARLNVEIERHQQKQRQKKVEVEAERLEMFAEDENRMIYFRAELQARDQRSPGNPLVARGRIAISLILQILDNVRVTRQISPADEEELRTADVEWVEIHRRLVAQDNFISSLNNQCQRHLEVFAMNLK